MNLKEFAKAKLVLSPLMENRTKIATEDVIGETLSLVSYDIVSKTPNDIFGLCVFKEYPDNFLFAGKIMTDLLLGFDNDFGREAALKMLEKEPLQLKLETKQAAVKNEKTGMKNTYTAVTIL